MSAKSAAPSAIAETRRAIATSAARKRRSIEWRVLAVSRNWRSRAA
ncbi:hypothetical protein [Sphingomonas sp. PP-CE-3G-477]|nr:hypothetical protein [Sphingomonas sp. PP-CE-3G-477]